MESLEKRKSNFFEDLLSAFLFVILLILIPIILASVKILDYVLKRIDNAKR